MASTFWQRLPAVSTLPIVFTSLILAFVVANTIAVQEYPTVNILRWMSSGDHIDWEYDNLTSDAVTIREHDIQTEYIVSAHVYALSISCNASYPVQWICNSATCGDVNGALGYSFAHIRSYRDSPEFENKKSYKYSSVLELTTESPSSTGAYSCQSVSNQHIQNNVYLYVLGNAPPYLVLAGQSIHVRTLDNNKTIVIPCHVASPTAQVILHKESAGAFYPEPASPYVNYDPQVGFTIKVQQIANPYGSYKCTIDGSDDEDDFVLVTSLQGLGQSGPAEIMKGNATFEYDQASKTIRCCATGAKPPNVHNMYCDDANSCKVLEKFVMQGGNNGVKLRNSSCTILHPYQRDTGVIRCKGDGIDIVRHYFTSFEQAYNRSAFPQVYFSWDTVDPTKFMIVEPMTRGFESKIYSNQTVYFICDTSNYFFADGVVWTLRWFNGTEQLLDETYSAYPESRRLSMRTIKLQAHQDMTNVTCHAPIWNSSEWATKTYDLKIYQSIAPVLVGPKYQDLQVNLNATNISILCNVEAGKPPPFIRWRKNSRQVVLNSTNVNVRRSNGSSIITFKTVYADIAGEYHCFAGNVAGRTERVIRVTVQVPTGSSGFGTAGIVITVLILLALVGGLGVLVWKMKLQKKIIDHLTGVVFRDMSNSTQANATT